MSSNAISGHALARLRQDYMRIKKDPVPYIDAEPLPSNILEWYYVVMGPEKTPYEGGYYLGKLVFPVEYPFKPPTIFMITPNGRFKPNTRLCLSMSDFHPDTWNPAWSASTILTGLLSFMVENSPTFGSMESTISDKRMYAANSLEFNLKQKSFCKLFPSLSQKIKDELEKIKQADILMKQQTKTDTNNTDVANQINLKSADKNNSILSHAILILAFAIFAWLVRFVVVNLS